MREFFSRKSIREKFIIVNAFILVTVGGFMFLYFPSFFKQAASERAIDNANQLTQLSALTICSVPEETFATGISQVIDKLKSDRDVRYFVVLNDSGSLLGGFNLDDARRFGYKDTNRISEESGEVIYRTSAPILEKNKAIAICLLGYSLTSVNREADRMRFIAGIVAAFLILGGMGLIILMSNFMMRPMRGILEVAEAAAKGDLSKRSIASRQDDIGRLSIAINAILMNSDSVVKRMESLLNILDKRECQLQEEEDRRKMIETQIQLSNDIINKVSALILVTNSTGGVEYANPSFEHVLGYKSEDLLSDGWWKSSALGEMSVIDRMRERNRIAKCARRETPISGISDERLIIDARGHQRWILWQETAGLNNTIISVGQDITERKAAEEQIREQVALLDITGDAIIVRNLDHRVIFWNRGAEKVYGISQEEAIGKLITELFENEDSTGMGIAYTNVIENGSWNGELNQKTRAGKKLIVGSRWTLMTGEKGKPKSILIVNTDVTEQRQLEIQFRRAQRLENIGTLAGGIAHDLNNVLSPILMSIEAMKRWHGDSKTQQLLSVIDISARRGADIVKQVLTFARGTEGERTLLQPKHIIREIEKITKETFPRSIEIRFDVPTHLWTIKGDATQLHQVILNLMVNARDAMPEGGKLNIRGENVVLDEEDARAHLNAKAGNYVVLSVSDSGTGIPPEVLEKIFDPFFTTKEIGKGTGLGLSTVMTIAKSYGGFITVDSVVGKGTAFKVFIPATNADVVTSRADESGNDMPVGRGESILVVDDELSIREITKNTLEAYGYRIQTAKDGIEALTLIEKERARIDLVLTDMMMPNMDGASLIRTLERLTPDIKIIAVSGLTDQDVLEKLKKSRVEAFIPKPIETNNLLRILDSILHPKVDDSDASKKK